jgi:hypothetical protein
LQLARGRAPSARGTWIVVIRGLGARHPDGNSSLLGATPLIDRDPTRPEL